MRVYGVSFCRSSSLMRIVTQTQRITHGHSCERMASTAISNTERFLPTTDPFPARHIGLTMKEEQEMANFLGFEVTIHRNMLVIYLCRSTARRLSSTCYATHTLIFVRFFVF